MGNTSSGAGVSPIMSIVSQQNYIMCSHVIAAAASSEQNSSVSCGQVKSKDVLYSDD